MSETGSSTNQRMNIYTLKASHYLLCCWWKMEPGKNVFTVDVSGLGPAVTVIESLITIIWACNEETLLVSEASEAPNSLRGDSAAL